MARNFNGPTKNDIGFCPLTVIILTEIMEQHTEAVEKEECEVSRQIGLWWGGQCSDIGIYQRRECLLELARRIWTGIEREYNGSDNWDTLYWEAPGWGDWDFGYVPGLVLESVRRALEITKDVHGDNIGKNWLDVDWDLVLTKADEIMAEHKQAVAEIHQKGGE